MKAAASERLDGPLSEVSAERLAGAGTAELVELARVSLGEGRIPRTAAFWDWKHRANPFGESLGFVGRHDNGLAGIRAFMRWQWAAGGSDFAAVRAVDTATHPDWRRRGLFQRLTETSLNDARAQGIRFVFNTPNERSLPGYLKMGWRRVGRVPIQVRPFRPFRGIARLARARVRIPERLENPAPAERAGSVFGRTDLALFGAAWRHEQRFHTRRSADYLLWRYDQIPTIRYGAAAIAADGANTLIVYRLRWRHGLLELAICELLHAHHGTASRDAAKLIRELGARTGADYAVGVGAPGTSEAETLRSAGFRRVPRLGPILVVRPVVPGVDLDSIESLASWRLSIGDMELF